MDEQLEKILDEKKVSTDLFDLLNERRNVVYVTCWSESTCRMEDEERRVNEKQR